jgi:hypothetical protein
VDPRGVNTGRTRARLLSRGLLGVALALIGAVMLFLGWYGVSGRANLAEQMPYIASGTIPGAALVVAAAVVLMSEAAQRNSERTTAMMSELHSLLVEDVPSAEPASDAAEPTPSASPDVLVAVEGGEHFHRGDCALAAGKAGVEPVGRAEIEARRLAPCPVCEPATLD